MSNQLQTNPGLSAAAGTCEHPAGAAAEQVWRRCGTLVFEHRWRGCCCEAGRIFRYQGAYYATIAGTDTSPDWYGPFPTLCEALPPFNNNAVTAASTAIRCPELSPEQLIPMLSIYAASHSGFTINELPYRIQKRTVEGECPSRSSKGSRRSRASKKARLRAERVEAPLS